MRIPRKGDLFIFDWDAWIDSLDHSEEHLIRMWESIRKAEEGTVYRVDSTRRLSGGKKRYAFFYFRSRPDGTHMALSKCIRCTFPKP